MSRLCSFFMWPIIASLSALPAILTLFLAAIPPSDITAISQVPPPMSTTIEPDASKTGRPAPSAAAMGSSISSTSWAPAARAASSTALRSTSVTPLGTVITTLVFVNIEVFDDL